jgi:predicted amidophosphoribosyltransferase
VLLLLRKSSVAGKYPITKLQLARQTLDQAALSREEREENLREAFLSPQNIQGCLILDDVTTTGATLDAMTKAVTEAGGSVTARAVLAKSFRN